MSVFFVARLYPCKPTPSPPQSVFFFKPPHYATISVSHTLTQDIRQTSQYFPSMSWDRAPPSPPPSLSPSMHCFNYFIPRFPHPFLLHSIASSCSSFLLINPHRLRHLHPTANAHARTHAHTCTLDYSQQTVTTLRDLTLL